MERLRQGGDTMGFHTGMIAVDGAPIKTPSTFTWKKQDVSSADAGRTQDALMHKMKVAEKRSLTLGWNNPTDTEVQEILSHFSPEYVNITYYDAMVGQTTKNFYTGDMQADTKMWLVNNKRYSQLSFEVIER